MLIKFESLTLCIKAIIYFTVASKWQELFECTVGETSFWDPYAGLGYSIGWPQQTEGYHWFGGKTLEKKYFIAFLLLTAILFLFVCCHQHHFAKLHLPLLFVSQDSTCDILLTMAFESRSKSEFIYLQLSVGLLTHFLCIMHSYSTNLSAP